MQQTSELQFTFPLAIANTSISGDRLSTQKHGTWQRPEGQLFQKIHPRGSTNTQPTANATTASFHRPYSAQGLIIIARQLLWIVAPHAERDATQSRTIVKNSRPSYPAPFSEQRYCESTTTFIVRGEVRCESNSARIHIFRFALERGPSLWQSASRR